MKYKIFILLFLLTSGAMAQPSFYNQAVQVLKKQTLREAALAMKQAPVTITETSSPRSAGGKHDFFSEADYFWPDPKSPDSPYVNRDGMSNPANFTAHRLAMIRLSRIVGALASAYKITGDQKYIRQAMIHCKAWFVDTATLMNPSLQFAQAIKGRVTGRGIGIIDTIQLMEVAEGLMAMADAEDIDKALLDRIRNWFARYLQWLTTHSYGREEMNATNNHGTCWAMQVAAFAKFTGNDTLMDFCRNRYKNVLLPAQMAADGSFPRELKRTKPYGYSLFNLDAMTTLCQILSTPKDDLWNYQTPDGRTIRKGIEYLYPFIADKSKWPLAPDVMYWNEWPVAQPSLIFGANAFEQNAWLETWKKGNHAPETEEVIRNLPVRHPLIWINEPHAQIDPESPAAGIPAKTASAPTKVTGNGDEDAEMFNRGKLRDQQAIDEANTGWWSASMRNHDERIAWWQKARFGMFIHWGIYSLPGGEWKGHKVDGYAEHLMRKEQISRKDYLELAHQFNPEKFDAVKWVSYAKQAGMKYIIITAKHHDGFAMFDTKVNDYNIVRQTPFAKDPMTALAAACKAQGIKFGFYYSHAFDWEDPDAPGNDWDYDNPGGDKGLHGGPHWFDLHPELLPKAQRYVDHKAIPQIKELITRYHPDILWFDTPGKLPLSENIRILKAIREADTNVVVNGRLARSADISFGDYKNTADRPEEFFPVTGDWEAIPTTNESYGYHQYDKSHKPVSHFIQLLAKSASRGGNLLMNIGPKGDGTFDDPDLQILQGIGNWMNKNGESIYGTNVSPLPMQNWGVSTMKGNKLYLHVFNWPADGKLYLGGLKSDAAKIYFLAGSGGSYRPGASSRSGASSGKGIGSGSFVQLTAARLNDRDIVISIPQRAPDTINTVIVMEFNHTPLADSNRYIAPNIPLTRLLSFDAVQHGAQFGFGDGKTNKYYVDGWKKKEQYLSWNFRTGITATYRIEVRYLAGVGSGGSWHWQLDGAGGDNQIVPTTKGKIVNSVTIGNLVLPEGVHELSIRPINIQGQELMKLLEVRLVAMPNPDDSSPVSSGTIDLPEVFAAAGQQTKLLLREIDSSRTVLLHGTSAPGQGPFSPRTLEHGELKLVGSRDWTSGFFPGVLWMLYEYNHDIAWKTQAEVFTASMEQEKTNGTTHDMGFKILCSVGNGYRLTNGDNPIAIDATHYKEVILQAARTLSTRFSPMVGCIRSWDHHRNLWGYPVIIDNMMNLELLFTATRLSGDSSFYKIAVSHANITMHNHFRPDYSSYHVVDYDSATGRIVKRMTWQGYSDSSAWARGQAWGLYAYTMCFRETRDSAYLRHAEHIAAFILHHPHLPVDKVPYWDFDAPSIPNEPRDASAAAVIASGLYELCRYSSNGREYRTAADTILASLTHRYRAQPGEAKGFILLHSTGSKPSNSEVDVPLNYADYYYLEALLRSAKPSSR